MEELPNSMRLIRFMIPVGANQVQDSLLIELKFPGLCLVSAFSHLFAANPRSN